MLKKGAVTGYILLALVMLLLLGISLYIKERPVSSRQVQLSKNSEVAAEAKPVHLFIEHCLQNTLQQAVVTIGKQGGYYQAPPLHILHEQASVPYYFSVTEDHSVKDLSSIEQQISLFVLDNIHRCLQNFSSFKETVKTRQPHAVARIEKDLVALHLTMPTIITQETAEYRLDTFESTVPVRLHGLFSWSKQLVAEHVQDSSALPLHVLTDTAYNQNFTYQLITYNASVVYRLIDNTTMILQQPYEFDFAIQYGW